MISAQPIDLLCIYVSEIIAYVINIWGCTEILLPLVHISGCPTEAKKTINLNAVSVTACLVHKVLKFLVCVTHDIMTWLRIFTAANALSLSVQGYTVTNTHLIRVRDCKWRNCFKIYQNSNWFNILYMYIGILFENHITVLSMNVYNHSTKQCHSPIVHIKSHSR